MNKVQNFVVVLVCTLCVEHAGGREMIWQCGQEFTDNPSALSEKSAIY